MEKYPVYIVYVHSIAVRIIRQYRTHMALTTLVLDVLDQLRSGSWQLVKRSYVIGRIN